MASSFTSAQQHHQHTTQTSITQSSTSSQQQHTLQSNRNGRELKLIASSFVKQYYTLLNKAPCFIHNFYNHDSTFIHGTIEMGSDNHTEPVVGREKIEEKMRELQLNDCRAKIKQIDCLETLAGGLVLQVIGELSNDGKPMRRFLQTFVLAPSPDQTRHDGDSHTQNRANDNRRGVQISENSANSPHNQKFYVSNSIFRYQDDGTDSEFEDDSISVRANTSMADNGAEQVNNDGHNIRIKASVAPQTHAQHQHKAATQVDQPKSNPKSLYVSDAAPNTEQQKRSETKVVLSNGTANSDRKNELSEKVSNENGKAGPGDHQLQTTPVPTNNPVEASAAPTAASQVSSTSAPATAPAPAAPITGPAPRPSNEPKTWANMVRSALPSSSATQPNMVASTKEQSSLNQAQNPSQQQQIPHQHHNQQQSAQSQNEQHQQNNTNNNNNNSNSNNSSNNNNNNNNRRRHMIRKTSNNKTGNINGAGGGTGAAVGAGNGRTIKNRPPRPTNPAAPVSKPTA